MVAHGSAEIMPKINGDRVIADLKRLAEFGRYKSGVHRPTYSPADVESRHWLAEKFCEAGLDTVIDGIGNVMAWADEEGHYGNFLGSRSFADMLTEEEIDHTRGRDNGMPLRDALEGAGFAGRTRERVDPARYVELVLRPQE